VMVAIMQVIQYPYYACQHLFFVVQGTFKNGQLRDLKKSEW
jgi:hypothetical protein